MPKKILLILVMTLIASCKSRENSTVQNSSLLDTNNAITINAPPQINSFKTNDFVGLVVQNNSEDLIALPPDYGVNIRMSKDNQWVNITDFTTTFKSLVILAPKSKKDLSFMLFDVIPKVEIQTPTTFRFTANGINQSTNQEVYAYIDLQLSP